MPIREYAGAAPETELASGISATSTSFEVNAGAGYPTGSTGVFFVVLDPNTASEEKILCSNRTGNVFTTNGGVAGRGADGTVAVTHSIGAKVRHVWTATDAAEANAHINAASGVHGLSGSVVGTTDTQTLTNKTVSGGTFSGTVTISGTLSGGTITGSTLSGPTLSGTVNAAAATLNNVLVRPSGSTDVALTVQERSGGGTGRMVEIKNAAGTVLGYLTEEAFASLANGAVQIGDGFGNGVTLRAAAAAADDVPLLARGAASQTADMFRVETSSGGERVAVAAAGGTRMLPALNSGTALILRGLASQTGHLLHFQDSGSNSLSWVKADGGIVAEVTTNSIGAFETYTPSITASSGGFNMGTSPTRWGRFQRLGNGLIFFAASIVLGTGPSKGTGFYALSLPVAPVAAGTYGGIVQVAGTIEDASTGTRIACSGWIQGGDTQVIRMIFGAGVGAIVSTAGNTTVGTDIPWAVATGDRFEFSGIYMSA